LKETKFFGITTVIVIIGFMFCACDNNTKDSDPCANGHAFSTMLATCAQASIQDLVHDSLKKLLILI